MTSEVAPLRWRKSKRSVGDGECVEVATDGDGRVLVRDSKDPDGPVLRFDRETWLAFLADVRQSRFDVPEVAGTPQRPSSGDPTVQ